MRFTDKVASDHAFANGIGRATAESWRRRRNCRRVDNHPGRLETRSRHCAMRAAGCMRGSATPSMRGSGSDVASVDEGIRRGRYPSHAVGGSTIVTNPSANVDELTLTNGSG